MLKFSLVTKSSKALFCNSSCLLLIAVLLLDCTTLLDGFTPTTVTGVQSQSLTLTQQQVRRLTTPPGRRGLYTDNSNIASSNGNCIKSINKWSTATVTSVSTTTASTSSRLFMATAEEKAAISVTGEQLEMMLQEWDEPLVIDAYATWCGPCLLMAPEFEEAAKDLKGKVRFAKLDTDKEEEMAARLNIMGLPTLLFLDKYTEEEDGSSSTNTGARAVLKGRIEGAMRKQNILDLCEHYFFDGPEPKLF